MLGEYKINKNIIKLVMRSILLPLAIIIGAILFVRRKRLLSSFIEARPNHVLILNRRFIK